MKKNNISNMLIAFILALGVSGVVYFIQTKPDSIVTKKEKPKSHILVAKVDLLPGQRVNSEKFKWVEWPESSISKEYYTKKKDKSPKSLKGMIVKYSVIRGEPLKRSDLIGGGDDSILGAFIQKGMKAVSVPLKKVANANVYFTPGDHIDIILPQRRGRKQSADTILNGIKIIAVDNKFFIPKGNSSSKVAKNITLEVTTEQAEALALSIAHGKIVISYHSALSKQSGQANKRKKVHKKVKVSIARGNYT